METRAYRIAFMARRLRLLSERPEFLKRDAGDRIEATQRSRRAIPLSFFDTAQVVGSGELDRLCAYALRRLRINAFGASALLDVLGLLEPDRVAAIYFALPANQRDVLMQDPACAHHVRAVEAEAADALADVEELVSEGNAFAKRRAELVAQMSGEDQAFLERVERGGGRCRAGLDHDLTDEEIAVIDGC